MSVNVEVIAADKKFFSRWVVRIWFKIWSHGRDFGLGRFLATGGGVVRAKLELSRIDLVIYVFSRCL